MTTSTMTVRPIGRALFVIDGIPKQFRRSGAYATREAAEAAVRVYSDPEACATCVNGCDCEIGTPGCGHYGCWGTDQTDDCPGVTIMRTSGSRAS